MDLLQALTSLPIPYVARCAVPKDLDEVLTVGEQAAPRDLGLDPDAVEDVWKTTEAIYRTGVHPGIQLCIRRGGQVVLHRSLGHAAGNSPGDGPEVPKVPMTLKTPANIFSASKAITAMVMHKLDERGVIHLEDRVCDFIPEFDRYGKRHVTLRHVLAHRSGIPNLPPGSLDLDLLSRPEEINELMCESKLQTRPGRMLAYHAVSGGFVLAEVVRRATGHDIRTVLEREIRDPLGLKLTSYGVPPDQVDRVAVNAFTGPPPPPPLSTVLRRALGMSLQQAVELSNDPRFNTGIIPSANIVTNAYELSAFYQCLLDGGEFGGARVFQPRTVQHATTEQSYLELDFTLLFPIRYGLGFMLGANGANPFGSDNEHAYGHVGLSNIFAWADPERALSVALVTTGKPIVGLHAVRIVQFLRDVGRAFPAVPDWRATARARRQD